jgi:hypothetical protein
LGYQAGINITTSSNNIEIGNQANPADTGTIRIGTPGSHTSTYIAGITGSAVSGADVVVNGSGLPGVVVSSARYKRDIRDMADSTDRLMKLRPVTFRYKNDPDAVTQYGLVAEEVERVYPELVVHDSQGKVESVRYSMLSAMLLNELQKRSAQLDRVTAQVSAMKIELNASREREHAQQTAFEHRLSILEHREQARVESRTLAAAFAK